MKSPFSLVPYAITQSPDGYLHAISAHGTIVARALFSSTPLTFTNIAEMRDVAPPELSRNEFDATTQTLNIDTYVVGVLRRSGFTLQLNALQTDGSQDHLTGLLKAMITEPPPTDGYKITFPDGLIWIMSGQISHFKNLSPVDGLMSVEVTLRPSGKMSIGGVVVG
jgi:Lambda phage tail tube protein, TTP